MGGNMNVVRRLVGLPIAIMIGVLSLVAGCGKEPATLARQAPDVTVMTVTARDTPVTFEFVAQTQSSREVEIRARQRGATRLLIAALEANVKGRAFWQREGFVPEQVFTNRDYGIRQHSVHRMTKPL